MNSNINRTRDDIMNINYDIEPDEPPMTVSPESLAAAGLRPLEWNELVRRGDFVSDGQEGFEPWDGPSGFRADAFIKQIYRRSKKQLDRSQANSVSET